MTPPVTVIPTPHLDPRIRVLRCGTIVDTFAIAAERFGVIVDTMVSAETMRNAMDLLQADRFTDRPLLVLNTHGDWDHVCGNGLFCGPQPLYPAPVIARQLSAELMDAPEARAYIEELKARYPGEFDTADTHLPTLRYGESLTIDCGDLTLVSVPTPGHRPDHMAFWSPELRLLLAGDAAENPMPFVEDSASLPILRESLQRMLQLNPSVVLYCHAPGVTDASVIRDNIAYFDTLEERCRTYLAAHAAPPSPDDNPAEALGWPLESALPPDLEPEDLAEPEPGFYAGAHARAIRAMLGWVADSQAGQR